MEFTILAMGSAIFASFANILASTLLKNIKSQHLIGINFLTMGISLLLVSPAFYFFDYTPIALTLLIVIGLVDTLGNYFYFKAFENSEVSVITPVLSLAPAVTFIFGWIFLDDKTSFVTCILALMLVASIIVLSSDFSEIKKAKSTSNILPAFLSSILFGFSAIPAKYLLKTLEVINAPTLYMFRSGYIALFSLVLFGFPIVEIKAKQYRTIFFRGLIVIAQWVLLYLAIAKGNVGVAVTLASTTPVFVFFIAAIFLHEKVTYKKAIASFLIIALAILITTT